jgi:DNA primase
LDAFTKEALGKGYKLEFLESTGFTIPRDDRPLIGSRACDVPNKYVRKSFGFGGRILLPMIKKQQNTSIHQKVKFTIK